MIKHLSAKLILLSVVTSLPLSIWAVQPMSESDLEVVSATTGNNILNIFGASQAGLTVDEETSSSSSSDAKLDIENYNEGETTEPIAFNELRAIEEDTLQNLPSSQEEIISSESQNTVLRLNESTTGSASVFSTSSEINYKTSNVQHNMRTAEDGSVSISRDLQIDILKLENLRGDSLDGNRSAGSIYLSDWSSRGDTRIISNQ